MWMLKPITQTGATDGRVEPSSPPHDRGHDDPEHVAGDPAILHQRGFVAQPVFWPLAGQTDAGRRPRLPGPSRIDGHFVAWAEPDRLRLAFLLRRHARRGSRPRAHPLRAAAAQA